jgi:anti-anti-sigma factor
MPSCFGRTFQASDHGFAVVARALPGDPPAVRVSLAGEIDIAASVVLSKAIDWLTALTPGSVLVDLTELTFACSTLANFVAQVRRSMPAGAELILWHARPTAGWVLRVTGMAAIATFIDEPAIP